MAIHLWWIGEAARDDAVMGLVRTHVQAAFETDVVEWMDAVRPHGTFDARRGAFVARDVGWLHAT
jgi:hypothetical protein